MYFSGKITNSVLNYLSKRGADIDRLFELTDTPAEFLRDPSCWLEAVKVENFLALVEREFAHVFSNENILELAGHSSFTLKSWGALDSVLKMMQTPQDIFTQPQRFISYFISPPPPIADLVRENDSISFELPVSSTEYPYVTEYLRSALEALPTFMNSSVAQAKWSKTQLKVSWPEQQESFFIDDKGGHNVAPEFMNSLIATIEKSEKQVEKKNRLLYEKNLEIVNLQAEAENLRSSFSSRTNLLSKQTEWALKLSKASESHLDKMQFEIMRLNDYLGRAQQLITLLVGQHRMNPQVKEAMRRVDWDYIKSEYPIISQEALATIETLKNLLSHTEPAESCEQVKVRTSLTEVVNKVVSKTSDVISKDISIDKMLFFDRPIDLYKSSIERVLQNLLNRSASSIKSSAGKIRIVTRPKGSKAEIEIVDTGEEIDLKEFIDSSEWDDVNRVINLHEGSVACNSSKSGSTFVINLPF